MNSMSNQRKTQGGCGVRERQSELEEIKQTRSCAAHETVQEEAEDFFTVVATGNVGTLRQFLKKHRNQDGSLDFDLNSVNFQNDSAMSVAVDKGNLEIVKCLAQIMNVSGNSILLKAVRKGDLDLVRGLCETLNADKALDHKDIDPEYPSCVTPLILAASEGHYEIVGFLMDRDHKIGDPHQPGCQCKTCRATLATSDPLALAKSTLYTYAAVSSPAYIPYVTCDPIHYSFRLYHRLKKLSNIDPPFRQNYDSLACKVGRFSAQLVSECRSSKEVDLVLTQKYSHSELPRVQMALDFHVKEFISNPKVQLVVQQKFLGDFDDWVYLSTFSQLIVILTRIFMMPMVYISFLVNPKSHKSRYYAAPVNKMINSLAMHLLFLFILFMETRTAKPSEHRHRMGSWWSLFIFLYFYSSVGMVVYQIMAVGLKGFLKSYWNLYDLIMVTMFSLFVAFSISSLVHVRMGKMISTERKQWNKFDPQLLAEGFLVISTVMGYLKLMFYLQASQVFGRLQVALGYLAQRLLLFSLFGAVVLLGYSLSLSNFYSYYSGMSYTDPETRTNSTQEESFTDALSSFKTFFWGFFGQSSPSAGDVVLDNENDHLFTQAVGYFALGSFFVLMILIFKSMLIIMAVKSTDDDINQTWLFTRTQFFMFFTDSPLLPPPFNLLPHRFSGSKGPRDLESSKIDSDEEYKQLAKALVERYFNTDLRNKPQSGSTVPKKLMESDTCQRSRCRSL